MHYLWNIILSARRFAAIVQITYAVDKGFSVWEIDRCSSFPFVIRVVCATSDSLVDILISCPLLWTVCQPTWQNTDLCPRAQSPNVGFMVRLEQTAALAPNLTFSFDDPEGALSETPLISPQLNGASVHTSVLCAERAGQLLYKSKWEMMQVLHHLFQPRCIILLMRVLKCHIFLIIS